jgi:hypothetical protein
MRRKNDARKDETEGVAQRLRSERPEASPLELDRIKMTAFSRAKAAAGARGAGARRFAVAGMTVGLMAAGTGGVIAGGEVGHNHGNAATAQYGNNCDTNNNNFNNFDNEEGNENNNGNNNFNCNNNSFNGSGNSVTNITNNITNSTVTVSATPPPAASSVLGSISTKAATSKRRITLHIRVPHKARLSRVTIKVNGKTVSVLKGKKASANVNLVNLPCSKGATTVVVIAVTDNGKTVKESHQFHLCQA